MLLGQGLLGTVPVVGRPLKLASASWLVATVITVMAGLVVLALLRGADRVRRLRRSAPQVPEGGRMSRRGFLAGVGRTVPVAAVATSVAGVANGASGFVVRREEFRIEGLPPALDGFRIGQITDVHVGAFIDAAYVRKAVEAVNAEGVDLQVMTGDLIDDLSQLDATFASLDRCIAPHGMLAILGNHEHWRGLPEVVAKYRSVAPRGKLKLLVNESVVIEHRGAKLRIVGVDYPVAEPGEARSTVMARHAERAFLGTTAAETIVCLAHHPDFFSYASARGARLTIAGHTHGGQLAFLGIPAFSFVFKYILGRYRQTENHLYVSGGTGHWLPFRVGVPAEVTILTLRTA
jgi:predicted MPP superfamily phosphohydrolase